jgi:protein involved in polysaccharide export with SLBB domain
MFRIRLLKLILCVMLLWVSSALRPAQAQSENVLAPNSSIHIVTSGEAEETGDYLLDSRGNITMQYVDLVPLAGLTVSQARMKVAQALRKYFKNPQVAITLLSAGAYRITGAVHQPAEYTMSSPNFTLADAIGRAGGIADRARLKETTIIRRGPDGRSYVMKLDASNPKVQASTLICREDDITIPVGSGGSHIDPLTLLGTAIGLGGLLRR